MQEQSPQKTPEYHSRLEVRVPGEAFGHHSPSPRLAPLHEQELLSSLGIRSSDQPNLGRSVLQSHHRIIPITANLQAGKPKARGVFPESAHHPWFLQLTSAMISSPRKGSHVPSCPGAGYRGPPELERPVPKTLGTNQVGTQLTWDSAPLFFQHGLCEIGFSYTSGDHQS
jgi:hypothetical protein